MTKRLLPAYPLFVNNPNFSVWSGCDALNGGDTMFWTGLRRRTYGLVYADGVCYCFMGKVQGAVLLEQTEVRVGLFSTDYFFRCEKFTLDISFVSPLLVTDPDLCSRPVCYFTYRIRAAERLRNVKIMLAFHQEHCYNKGGDFVIGGAFAAKGYETAYFGLNRQLPMSNTFDNTAPDWGYTYLAAQRAMFTSERTLSEFVACGKTEYRYQNNEETKFLVGVDVFENVGGAEGRMAVGYDQQCAAFYFGEWLNVYYYRGGKTIFDALEEAYTGFERTMERLAAFERDFDGRLASYDEDYRLLCRAAYRQTMGGHLLAENRAGELLFLSKECHSNGCVATVDITYPSMPLFLLFQPALVTAMLRPVFAFAKKPVWNFEFAPHDAGTYPYCLGQTYGLKACSEKNTRFHANSFQRNRSNGIVVTHPMIYTFPANADIYRTESQMPLEECSNMLIISYATIVRGADDALIRDNYALLKQWYGYLSRCGIVPAEQLCTDDFAERLDKNVGLSVKCIVAVRCFSLLAEKLGYEEDARQADACFSAFRKEFEGYFSASSHLPLTYDSDASTYGLKYNMAYDVLFGTDIFPERMRENEVKTYLEHNTPFGVPLDSRSDLVKTDWIFHVCVLTRDAEQRRALYCGVANFLRQSPCRVPFSDLYHAETGEIKDFRNRTVQGGVFILLLADEMSRTEDKK